MERLRDLRDCPLCEVSWSSFLDWFLAGDQVGRDHLNMLFLKIRPGQMTDGEETGGEEKKKGGEIYLH